jgi:hypothetical protein
MTTLTSTQTFVANTNPGDQHNGPSHPPSVYDHLPLPGNTTVGKTDTDTLRGIFHRLGIPDSHHLGRDKLCERYNALLHKIPSPSGRHTKGSNASRRRNQHGV